MGVEVGHPLVEQNQWWKRLGWPQCGVWPQKAGPGRGHPHSSLTSTSPGVQF